MLPAFSRMPLPESPARGTPWPEFGDQRASPVRESRRHRRKDDEAITTPFSFVASANCLLYERAVPRFVDIDIETYNIDRRGSPRRSTAAPGPSSRCMFSGCLANLHSIGALAARHSLAVIRMPARRSAPRSAGGPWEASARAPRSPSIRTSRSPPARARHCDQRCGHRPFVPQLAQPGAG